MPFVLDPTRLRASRRYTSGTPPISQAPTSQYRIAAMALFALIGAVFGSWASRIPDITADLALDPTTLGLLLLCVSLGALASMQLTGALCARLGPGLVSVAAAVVTSGTLALPGLASSPSELAGALLLFGVATGAVNVAANAVGIQVERAAGRPLLPSLHAAFSFGGLAGAAVGGLVAESLPTAVHLLCVGAVGLGVTAAIAPTLVARDAGHVADDAATQPGPAATAARSCCWA